MNNVKIGLVLEKAHKGGFKTKSNFARELANEVAVAASIGLITTRTKGNQYGTTWYITKQGLESLNECYQS